MATPNSALRAVRMSMRLSQDELARALRDAGAQGASKRLVQRWEAGTTAAPRPVYIRALEAVTRLPIAALGFSLAPAGNGSPAPDPTPAPRPDGDYSGVWLSRYRYVSSGRDGARYVGQHYVVLLQHGEQLTARSIPGSADSTLAMDLTVERNIVTGTWTEHTNTAGYYRGATYHGAIQLLVEPTGRRMSGQWVGFGKEMDVNTGPWQLIFADASTSKATLDAYAHHPPVPPDETEG